jgi:hypothetical protein
MRARIDAHRGGMRVRIDAHRVKGGLKPTPAMPGMCGRGVLPPR